MQFTRGRCLACLWILLAHILSVLSAAAEGRGSRKSRSTTECVYAVSDPDRGFFVFLTVNAVVRSSVFRGVKSRAIELNWTRPPSASSSRQQRSRRPRGRTDDEDDDWVGLFRMDPEQRLSEPLVRVNASQHEGYFKTEFRFPQNPMLGVTTPEQTCLFNYWIGYVRNNITLKSNCLQLRPRWMWEERETIGDIPLHALMIPGSHNSGSYKVIDSNSADNILNRYSINQGEDVWHQLLYGVRYLDLRVGLYDDPEKFWVVHDAVKMNPLYVVLQDVRRFLTQTNEIVIMDFHRFPYGFQNASRHNELVQYLYEELGEWMAPDWLGRDVTPNDLWHVNKTLVVTYSHDPSSVYDDKIWFEVRHAWGNKRNPDDLKAYLTDAMYMRYSATYLWAAMAHLTPSSLDFFLNPGGGFASLSDRVARKVSQWFRDEWWNSANLVATDFILGNNVIDESIRANRKRKECRSQQTWLGRR